MRPTRRGRSRRDAAGKGGRPTRKTPSVQRGRGHPTGIGEILQRMIRSTDLGDRLQEAEIWAHWETIAGPYLSPHSRPVAVRERVLHIEADSPVWMHKLAFKKWELVRRINVLARRELVSDVFLRLAEDDPEEDPDRLE